MSLARRPLGGFSFGGDADLSDQEAFETLSNERRRYVVRQLSGEDRTDLRTLSRHVAAWENDKSPDRVSAKERRRVYNALQQFHLPKLDDLGVIRYDCDRGIVETTDSLNRLKTYLDAPDYGWCRPSLLLVGTATGVAVAALIAGFLTLPLYGVLLGVMAVAVWYAARQHYTDRPTTEET